MSDYHPDEQPSPDLEGSRGQLPVNPSRRKFARLGAAAPVVLGSLVSKPVLALTSKQLYPCTTSGIMSGNFSSHPNTINCKSLGLSPGYWKTHPTAWPAGTIAGALPPAGSCAINNSDIGTIFDGFSSGGKTFPTAFKCKVVSGACTIYDARQGFNGATQHATMLQILNTEGGLNDYAIKALGRATVASVLNSLSRGADYPISVAKIIDMFNAVYMNGGKYQVNATTAWDSDQVLLYFQSLYN